MPNTFVFVYGTLKRDFYNHDYMENSAYVGNGILRDHAIYKYAFPVVYPDSSHDVSGELFIVSAKTVARLDRLEANGDMYHRKLLDVHSERFATDIKAYVYIGSPTFWDFNTMTKLSSHRIHDWGK